MTQQLDIDIPGLAKKTGISTGTLYQRHRRGARTVEELVAPTDSHERHMSTGELEKAIEFILEFKRKNSGAPPALTDMAEGMGFQSTGKARVLVENLLRSDLIRRTPNKKKIMLYGERWLSPDENDKLDLLLERAGESDDPEIRALAEKLAPDKPAKKTSKTGWLKPIEYLALNRLLYLLADVELANLVSTAILETDEKNGRVLINEIAKMANKFADPRIKNMSIILGVHTKQEELGSGNMDAGGSITTEYKRNALNRLCDLLLILGKPGIENLRKQALGDDREAADEATRKIFAQAVQLKDERIKNILAMLIEA